MTYPFVQARFDYGSRTRDVLGLMYHMAEGFNTVAYLANSPARGVSVHAVCEQSGRVVQMLDWDHVSGSLNPADRSTDKGYYGHSTLVDVLGGYWTDPNTVVLSMEIEGFRADGPNSAQVAGAVAWGNDMKGRYATLRGALGHADQTDTKGCPGLTAAMKSIFAGVGGHGLWQETEVITTVTVLPYGGTFTIPTTAVAFEFDTTTGTVGQKVTWTPVDHPLVNYDATVVSSALRGNPFVRVADGAYKGWLVSAGSVNETLNQPPATDCAQLVADARAAQKEADRMAAIAAVGKAIA